MSEDLREYGEIRKDYVLGRLENLLRNSMRFAVRGNWRQAAKEEAHREFNEFVQNERNMAAQDARVSALAEGWDQGWVHRGGYPDRDTDEYGHNPYRDLIRERQQAELKAVWL